MIVLEGPDGSGKTTLLEKLSAMLELPRGPRASTSVGGPIPDLFQWAWTDVHSWPTRPLMIYDRHPLISEYVYGPITRNRIPPGFLTDGGLYLRQKFIKQAMVVFCLPPLDIVRENVLHEDQMEGVIENTEAIWSAYSTMAQMWPGRKYLYRYDEENLYSLHLALSWYQTERTA